MTRVERRCSIVWACLTVATVFPVAVRAQESVERSHYVVEGTRVDLTRNPRFAAVHLPERPTARQVILLRRAVSRIRGVELLEHPLLEERDIVLARVDAGIDPEDARRMLRSAVIEAHAGRRGPREVMDVPVYGHEDGLVLVNRFLVQFEDEVSPDRARVVLDRAGASRLDVPRLVRRQNRGRYVVTFDETDLERALVRSNELHRHPEVAFSEPDFIVVLPPDPGVRVDPEALHPLREGPSRPTVGKVIPGGAIEKAPAVTPNDVFFSKQWYLNNSGNGAADVSAPEAWEIHKAAGDVVVAILDDGVYASHQDLASQVPYYVDLFSGSGPFPQPWDTHGTAMAGVAGALTNNGLGMAGVAWDAEILPIRVAYSAQQTGPLMTTVQTLELGILTAVAEGADVLSNSWGYSAPSNAVNGAIDAAVAADRVVVFSAGNEGTAVSYPANLAATRDIMAISATDKSDGIASTSLWASNTGPEVDLAAPGVDVFTSLIALLNGSLFVGYGYVSGTSPSAALVSGAAALLRSQHPDWSASRVISHLERTSTDLGAQGPDDQFGEGRLNLYLAVFCDRPYPAGTPPAQIALCEEKDQAL